MDAMKIAKLVMTFSLSTLAAIGGSYLLPTPPQTASKGCVTIEENIPRRSVDILDLINAERLKAGLNTLARNLHLDRLAAHKAYDYKETKEWSHDISGKDWLQIYGECGVKARVIGENLAKGFTEVTPTPKMLNAWLNSPSHRENILKPTYTQIGIFSGDSEVDYYTVTTFSD